MAAVDPSDIKILVAAHKPYWMPSDPVYLPVQVGAALSDRELGFQRDDAGENISAENPRYCELTALYWAWKNLDAAYVGLSHYRRYFAGAGERGVLTGPEAAELLSRAPIVLPKRRHYVIWSVKGHYDATMLPGQLDVLREVLADQEPAFVDEFDRRMGMRSAHILNMAIMRRDLFDAYMSWLFPVLRAVEARIDFSNMTLFEARCMGRLSERLLDTWIAVTGASYVEQPLVSLEGTNWTKKGVSFLSAKFLGKKYEQSF